MQKKAASSCKLTACFAYLLCLKAKKNRLKRSFKAALDGFSFGAPAGTRTPDTLLKRQVLYLLSYWGKSIALSPLPKSKPGEAVSIWKGRGRERSTVFAAFTQTAETERCELPLMWLGWRDSNPLYRSQSPVCYHYTTSQ